MSILRVLSICVRFEAYRQSGAHGVTVVAGLPVHAVRQVEGAPRPGRELGLLTSAANIFIRRKIFHGPRKYFVPGTRLGHHGEALGLGRQGEEEEEEHGGGSGLEVGTVTSRLSLDTSHSSLQAKSA